MKRSTRAALVAAVLAGLLVAAMLSLRSTLPNRVSLERPDLLLITIDTLRADRVGVYGGPRGITPNLDDLAGKGVRFADATAHAPLTLPSHASILTGQLPGVHGIRDNAGFVLPESAMTLAEWFRANGYATAAFVGSYILTASTGMSQGFDTYADRFNTGRTRLSYAELQKPAVSVVEEALAWLRQRSPSDQPMFMWVHLYDPHAPYVAPKAFADRFPGQPYNAEVAATDWAIGDLIRGLPPPVASRSIVMVTADHGESLDEHGEAEHGIFLYDATLRVPLIVSGAGIPSGRTVTDQVRHIDLLPTLSELANVPVPQGVPGTSLVALIHGGHRGQVPFSYSESWFGQLHFGWSELRAVRTGDWKLVQAPRPELYDLRNDPGERRNLIGERANIASRLAGLLATVTGPVQPVASRSADTATVERLRSLGYLAGGGGTALGSSLGSDPKDRIAEYMEFVTRFYAAVRDLEDRKGERALRQFRDLARQHPLSYEAHQYVGRTLSVLGRPREAVDEYRIVLQLKPDLTSAYFDAALAEAETGRISEADGLVEKGLALEPDSFYGHYVKGRIDVAGGRAEAAGRAFERALKLNPGMALAHYELGRLEENRGSPSAAIDHYRRALTSDEDFVEARRALERLETKR